MPVYHAYNGSCAFNSPLYPGDGAVEVRVVKLSGGSPVDAVLKTNRDGSTDKGNPFNLVAGDGKIQFYSRRGRYNITARRGALSATIENFYIGPQTREKQNKTASFELTDDDDFTLIETTGSSNIVVTVPEDQFDTEYEVSGIHFGTGTLTFVGESEGVGIIFPEALSLGVPTGGPWTLMKSKYAGENVWALFGFLNLAT